MKRSTILGSVAALALVACSAIPTADATPVAIRYQGYESGSYIWMGAGSTTRVLANGTTSPTSASGGDYYLEVTEGGSFDGGYTDFGGNYPTYSGSVVQSLDVYVDLGWADPTDGGNGFKLNMFPSDTTGKSIAEAGEQFLFSFTPSGDMNIEANGKGGYGHSITTLTDSGWYTFAATFRKGTDGFIKTDLAVYDAAGTFLGMQTRGGGANSLLGGHAYIWISNWHGGFADNTLAIDNADTYVLSSVSVPEPSSLGMFVLGLLALSFLARDALPASQKNVRASRRSPKRA